MELEKRLGRRKKVFDEIEYKENVAKKQNETAHFELVGHYYQKFYFLFVLLNFYLYSFFYYFLNLN